MSKGRIDQGKTEVVSISRALRPGFDFFIGLQVMPCLTACFVQEPPSRNVSFLWCTDRGYRRSVEVLLRFGGICIAIQVLPCHL